VLSVVPPGAPAPARLDTTAGALICALTYPTPAVASQAGISDGTQLHATLASRPIGSLDGSSPGGAAGLGPPPPTAESALLNDPMVSSMLDSPEMLATLHGAILNNPQVGLSFSIRIPSPVPPAAP